MNILAAQAKAQFNTCGILAFPAITTTPAAALLQDGIIGCRYRRRTVFRRSTTQVIRIWPLFCAWIALPLIHATLIMLVFYEKPFLKFERLLISTLQTFPHQLRHISRGYDFMGFADKLWIKTPDCRTSGYSWRKNLFSEHHISMRKLFLLFVLSRKPLFWRLSAVVNGRLPLWSWASDVGYGRPKRASRVVSWAAFSAFPFGLLYSGNRLRVSWCWRWLKANTKVNGNWRLYGKPRFADDRMEALFMQDEQAGFQLAYELFYVSPLYTSRPIRKNSETVWSKPVTQAILLLRGEYGDALDRDEKLLAEGRHYAILHAKHSAC